MLGEDKDGKQNSGEESQTEGQKKETKEINNKSNNIDDDHDKFTK